MTAIYGIMFVLFYLLSQDHHGDWVLTEYNAVHQIADRRTENENNGKNGLQDIMKAYFC